MSLHDAQKPDTTLNLYGKNRLKYFLHIINVRNLLIFFTNISSTRMKFTKICTINRQAKSLARGTNTTYLATASCLTEAKLMAHQTRDFQNGGYAQYTNLYTSAHFLIAYF